MAFPGIDKLEPELVIRSMGAAGSSERLCAGFMRKRGMTADFQNAYFPTYALVYVARGNGTYIDFRGRPHELSPGSFFQRLPDRIHSNFVDPQSDYLECCLDVGPKLFAALREMRVITDDTLCGHIGLDMSLIERFWTLKTELKHAPEDQLDGILLDLLALQRDILRQARLEQHGDDTSHMIELGCRYLSANATGTCNVRGFCKSHGWGYERFRKVFAERMGISPNQYRIRRRLDIACQMLNDTATSIGAIAYHLGYSSQFEFSAQFKRHLDLSPSAYRAKRT